VDAELEAEQGGFAADARKRACGIAGAQKRVKKVGLPGFQLRISAEVPGPVADFSMR